MTQIFSTVSFTFLISRRFQTIAEAQAQNAALYQHAHSQPLRVQQRLLIPGT
jgi:hypothetical protein